MMARNEDRHRHHLRALAARAVADSLRAGAGGGDRASRFEDCVRSLEAEKAKMEVFRRELPISVHLVADVIDWLKDELRRGGGGTAPAPARTDLVLTPAKAKQPAADAPKPEADGDDASDKRSWMSSAQLWTCGAVDMHCANGATTTAAAAANSNKQPAHKVSSAFVPPLAGPPTLARPSDDDGDAAAGKPAAVPVPDLSLSSPAVDGAAAPSATSSAVTDVAGARRQNHHHHHQQQQQQRKARRCWSPELHRRFVAALQRLGGAQVATPKQIRELMKVDGLTNDEVKSHLQKYRLHTRRASSDGGDHQHQHQAQAAAGVWPAEQRYAASQHSTSQSGSPQGPLQLTVSSRAMSATAGGDSCDGDEAEGGRSESYSWEHGAKASPSS